MDSPRRRKMEETSKNERLTRAADHLGAVELDDGDYAYYADETGSYWVVDAYELADLCDYLDDEDPSIADDAYSHWCAGTSGREMRKGWEPDR
jgi:phage pi2 protein 07